MSGTQHEKNTERVARGLKASIHNPRVSPEAKAHAEERLHEMGYDVEPRPTGKGRGASRTGKRSEGRGRRSSAASKTTGEKAISEEVPEAEGHEAPGELKEPEEEKVQEGEAGAAEPTPSHSKHEARVLGGYKATLSKKGVSEEAKRHARQVLEEHDAI